VFKGFPTGIDKDEMRPRIWIYQL